MAELRIPIPEGLSQSLQMSEEELTFEICMVLAVKWYELGRISAGVAAQLASIDRLSFLNSLAYYRVPVINLQDEEVTAEIEAARKLANE